MIDAAGRTTLLAIARDAIASRVTGAATSSANHGALARLRCGVFVSVYCRGQLRGCIGHLAGHRPLPQAVVECAVAAATADPRFAPIAPAEVQDLEIEVSVLGPLERIDGPSDIEVGRHGLVVERDRRRGLLLPQVAAEWQWDATTFLARTCQKAGLPLDAWRHGAALWRFEAEVFGTVRDVGHDPKV